MSESTELSDFWLPDLCNPLAFLRLILLGVFITIVLTLFREGVQGFVLAEMGRRFLYSVWIVFMSAAGLCQLRKWRYSLSVLQSACLAVLWLVFAASICALAACEFALQLSVDGDCFSVWSETTLLTLILGCLALRFLYVHHEIQRQQRQLMQAQYDALQARIRPHFLFNSLNSIATLVGINAQRAEAAILDLSDLLRATLGEKVEHSLADELAICSKYLGIEALRMDDRMNVQIDVQPELKRMRVPSLFLQPLLENAVLHGLQQLPGGGQIDLQIKRSDTDSQRVFIDIQNPLPADRRTSTGSGSALENTRSRLAQYYPEPVKFSAEARDGVFHVRIELNWADSRDD